MKKLYTLTLLIASCAAFAQASDSFIGTGSLNANGWVTHSGATPGQQTIAPGSLSYAGFTTQGNKTQLIAGNTEDVNLATPAITGVAYYSLLINLPNTDGLAANTDVAGNYFVMFATTAGGTGVTGFNGRIYIKAGTAAGTYNLGILNGAGGTATPTYNATDYSAGTTLFLVSKFDFATNTASLFVNPALGGSEPTATVTNATGTSVAPAQFASIALRQAGNATAGTGNIDIDEVRIGGTWEFVTASVLAVKQNEIAGLNVYPNPVTNGVLYINTLANAEKNIVIYDVLGKQVFQTTTATDVINIASVRSGAYILKITEAGKTATSKLVVR